MKSAIICVGCQVSVKHSIYADADKRAARFVARGETKAKFEAREQSEDEQFCDYENNHGWDIIIYNNWDIDTAVKTMLGYVRPIMTPGN